MTNREILRIAKAQSAIDCACAAADFDAERNTVVISKPHEDARRYLKLPHFCDLVSYGNGVVASVDGRVADFVAAYLERHPRERAFEPEGVSELTEEFAKYGKKPYFAAEYWLPDADALTVPPCEFEVKILAPEDFTDLYVPQWRNALSEKRPHLDVLGAGAYDGGRLVGLAGCSADCETMWQIGIDVLPEFRRRGLASALTSRLAAEILARGKVPFYCCAWSNVGSARNAIKSGFRPAWVELSAADK
ncbi:MAG: GNAT family N-acetyltransferase [Oscillospiraceae bacterium]|jgi:GNAT superfamily N-acetyltransferase|nr:GNAT family N-acetyltransferase [Oscillospiraceae bacterium]